MPVGPRRYRRQVLSVQLVFGLPDHVMEYYGPTDGSPEDLLVHLEQALETGELDEGDILQFLADRQRSAR